MAHDANVVLDKQRKASQPMKKLVAMTTMNTSEVMRDYLAALDLPG